MSIGPDDQDQVVGAIIAEIREMSTQAVVLSQVIADRLGMNPTDLECLGVISAEGSLTAGRLADLTGLTTGAITGVVDRLEKSGYVQRENDPTDRRRVIIRALAERQQDLQEPFAGVMNATLELLTRYDPAQLATIRDFIVEANAVGRSQIARLRDQTTKAARRAPPRAENGHEFSAPLASATQGQLVFANGATQVTLASGTQAADLYRAHFTNPLPSVQVRAGTVTFRYTILPIMIWLDWRERPAKVTLNHTIPWHIEVAGGTSKVQADLRGLPIKGIELSGGAVEVELLLGPPVGTAPIRISGGAHKLTINRPSGVAARVYVSVAGKNLRIEDRPAITVAGDTHWESPHYQGATDRYDIAVLGGSKDVTISST